MAYDVNSPYSLKNKFSIFNKIILYYFLARQRVEWSRSILDAMRVSTLRRDGTHARRDPSSSKGRSEGDAQNKNLNKVEQNEADGL